MLLLLCCLFPRISSGFFDAGFVGVSGSGTKDIAMEGEMIGVGHADQGWMASSGFAVEGLTHTHVKHILCVDCEVVQGAAHWVKELIMAKNIIKDKGISHFCRG